jgi:hypothetical protein
MPIKLISKSYTDIYGNSTDVYKANAGDKITTKLVVSSDIYVRSSSQNSMYFDVIDGLLTQNQGDFIQSGFRVGQSIIWKDVNNSNSIIGNYSATILQVTELSMTLDTGGTLPSVNNSSSQGSTWVIYSNSFHDYLELNINFVKNSLPNPSLNSMIDGEIAKFVYNGLNAISVGSTVNLTQLGKLSGQFGIVSATVKRTADSTNVYVTGRSVRNYEITFDTIFIGILFPSVFIGSDCLKQYTDLIFKVIQNESYKPSEFKLLENGNTAFYEQAYKNEITNFTSISSIFDNIYFNNTSSLTFDIQMVGTSVSQIEIGACYSTFDENYNLNQKLSQSKYLHLLKTGLIDASSVGTSFLSDGQYPYLITINSFSYIDISGNRKFTIGITIDPQYSLNKFGTFIESRGDNDRLFLVWIKAGNTNRLLFNNQMSRKLSVGTMITPLNSILFNHYCNNDYSDFTNPTDNTDFNLEDDLGFISDFNLLSIDSNKNITISIVARNTIDNKEFNLEGTQFDLSSQNLTYFIDTFNNVNNNLPNSSLKKISYLKKKTDISGGVTVRLYYPFLIHWEYWIKQLNSDIQFKSLNTNNKNWLNYEITNWKLSIKVEISRNGVNDWFYKDFTFKNYNDSTITSSIQLFSYPSMTYVNSPIENGLHLIRATHIKPTAYFQDIYGQITIENKENSPRYLMSTVIDTNVDNQNPLSGIEDNKLKIDGLGTNTVMFSCLLDMSKTNNQNICISSKISEDRSSGGDLFIFTTGIGIENTNNVNYITA